MSGDFTPNGVFCQWAIMSIFMLDKQSLITESQTIGCHQSGNELTIEGNGYIICVEINDEKGY